MAIMRASGNWHGEYVTVEIIDGTVLVNQKQDTFAKDLLQEQYVMAGTFYAPPTSELNMFNTLQHHFFDEEVDVELIGKLDIEIPSEVGFIY